MMTLQHNMYMFFSKKEVKKIKLANSFAFLKFCFSIQDVYCYLCGTAPSSKVVKIIEFD